MKDRGFYTRNADYVVTGATVKVREKSLKLFTFHQIQTNPARAQSLYSLTTFYPFFIT